MLACELESRELQNIHVHGTRHFDRMEPFHFIELERMKIYARFKREVNA